MDADCTPPPTLEAAGKADLESLENVVPPSFSVNELSHKQCKKGINFVEGKPRQVSPPPMKTEDS